FIRTRATLARMVRALLDGQSHKAVSAEKMRRSPTPFFAVHNQTENSTEVAVGEPYSPSEMKPLIFAIGRCCRASMTVKNDVVHSFQLCNNCLCRNDTLGLLESFPHHLSGGIENRIVSRFA
ncbi:unnamed protein product, partial [Auanema sp. JU1783]